MQQEIKINANFTHPKLPSCPTYYHALLSHNEVCNKTKINLYFENYDDRKGTLWFRTSFSLEYCFYRVKV